MVHNYKRCCVGGQGLCDVSRYPPVGSVSRMASCLVFCFCRVATPLKPDSGHLAAATLSSLNRAPLLQKRSVALSVAFSALLVYRSRSSRQRCARGNSRRGRWQGHHGSILLMPGKRSKSVSVSYTHLTLPTIYSV